ncbi:MAG: ATP-binding cassette domain-containing protein, partial [Chlamydiia bacterium]|nr:ATP-binding cassette domain-containing protein [Chlamydiia bacterium]
VDIPFILIFISIIGLIGGKLMLIPTQAAALVVISSILISIPLMRAVKQSFVGSGQKAALLQETIAGAETIKSTTSQGYFIGRWQKYVAITASHAQESRYWSTLALLVSTVLISLATVGVVIWGVYLIRDGELTVGGLIACTILTGRALAPLGQIAAILIRYQQARCSLTALDDLMNTEDEIQKKGSIQIKNLKGEIELDKISFRYPEQSTDLFNNFSLKIHAGEKVAILGNIGSGKSTLLKLMQGLYTPTDGSVRIDNIDVRQLDLIDLRKQVGYLDQDPTLFFGTIRDNIALKAPWVDDNQILAAANLSGAIQFIGKDPKGFGFTIGENGKGLSGGQKQAIALARTLLIESGILLFDEPTASMDAQLERYFVEQMKSYCKNKTLVLTTYKNVLLELVNRIVVIQNGKIHMDGPKNEILTRLSTLSSGGA